MFGCVQIDADSLAKAVGYVERVRPVGVFSAALSAYALALSYKINETQYQRVRKIMADYIGWFRRIVVTVLLLQYCLILS